MQTTLVAGPSSRPLGSPLCNARAIPRCAATVRRPRDPDLRREGFRAIGLAQVFPVGFDARALRKRISRSAFGPAHGRGARNHGGADAAAVVRARYPHARRGDRALRLQHRRRYFISGLERCRIEGSRAVGRAHARRRDLRTRTILGRSRVVALIARHVGTKVGHRGLQLGNFSAQCRDFRGEIAERARRARRVRFARLPR